MRRVEKTWEERQTCENVCNDDMSTETALILGLKDTKMVHGKMDLKKQQRKQLTLSTIFFLILLYQK